MPIKGGRRIQAFRVERGDHSSCCEKVFPLGEGLRIYPGHGPVSTVGRERAKNPFFA